MGVALETRCHLGQTVLYDTVTKLGWSANIIHHGIAALIDGVLAKEDLDWGEEGVPRSVPPLTTEDDCVVSAVCVVWGDGEADAGLCRTASSGSSATTAMFLSLVLVVAGALSSTFTIFHDFYAPRILLLTMYQYFEVSTCSIDGGTMYSYNTCSLLVL